MQFSFYKSWNYYYLLELKYKFFYSFLTIFITSFCCYIYKFPILFLLSKTFLLNIDSNKFFFSNLIQVFFFYIEFSLYVGCFISLPFILLLIYSFFIPSSYLYEIKGFLKFLIFFFFFFFFSFYCTYLLIFPNILEFFLFFENTNSFFPLYFEAKFEDYFVFVFKLFFKSFLIFQIPFLFFFLYKFKYISKQFFFTKRKFMYIFFLLLSAIISPPEIIFQCSFFIFFIFFYEIFLLLLLIQIQFLIKKSFLS